VIEDLRKVFRGVALQCRPHTVGFFDVSRAHKSRYRLWFHVLTPASANNVRKAAEAWQLGFEEIEPGKAHFIWQDVSMPPDARYCATLKKHVQARLERFLQTLGEVSG